MKWGTFSTFVNDNTFLLCDNHNKCYIHNKTKTEYPLCESRIKSLNVLM